MSLPQSISPSPMPSTSGEALLGDDDAVGLASRDDRDGVGALDRRERACGPRRRGLGAAAQLAVDEVGDDLGVGVATRNLHALRLELAAGARRGSR